jgi:hypothetical protein
MKVDLERMCFEFMVWDTVIYKETKIIEKNAKR